MKEKLAKDKGYSFDKEGNLLGPKGKCIAKYANSNGYYVFSIRYKTVRMNLGVHRFQAYLKYGDKIYEKGIVVRHLNGNKFDNSWNNIAIGTAKENTDDIPRDIIMRNCLIATSFVRKYDKDIIRAFHNTGKSYKETMKEFNISSKGTLHFILNK